MGLFGSGFQIGRSALLSYQAALEVVGSNVSGAGTADYTRLTPGLQPLEGRVLGSGLQPGAGVVLSDIRRHVDAGLEHRLREAIGTEQDVQAQSELLAQIEVHFNDADGQSLFTQLNNFFNTFDDLRHNPEDVAIRDLTLASGTQLTEALQRLRTNLISIGQQADSEIGQVADRVSDIGQKIAEINQQITGAEAGHSGQDSGLRDQRDALLRELAQLVDVTTREQPNGVLNVYIGSEALVQGGAARRLTSEQQSDGAFLRTAVQFADTGAELRLRSGRLAGLMTARDREAYGRVAALDELSRALIQDVNRVHSDGQGLVGFEQVRGTRQVTDVEAALSSNASGLLPPVQDGSFYVTVADDTSGASVAYRIDVKAVGDDNDTTLATLVEQFNQKVVGVTASIDGQNQLVLTAQGDFRFTFGYDGAVRRADTSNVLASLGLNTFFIGNDASDIGVNPTLLDEPGLLAASSVFLSGDGEIAGQIADLNDAPSAALRGSSIADWYDGISADVALSASQADKNSQIAGAVASSLTAQREAISGVNLDEEAISLVRYERAYQGAARYLSTVNQLVTELVSLLG